MKKAAVPSILVAVVLLAVAVIAEAQQTGKVLRIGFLDATTASGSAFLLEVVRQELTKLGWIEGKNITIEYRFAEQKNERLPELAADSVVRLKVDLIVVSGTPPALAAKNATTAIPIVMANVGDPVGAGLVASLARAGRQCHRERESIARAKYQKARDTQGRSTQARPSWISAVAGIQCFTPNERTQTCSFGIEAKIGGDRDSTRLQKFRERLSKRKAEAGQRDYDDRYSPIFR